MCLQKKQTLPVKDKTSAPPTIINKPPNQKPTEQFPSYIHNSAPASNSSPDKSDSEWTQPSENDKMPTQESLSYENPTRKSRSTVNSESSSSFERIDPSPSVSFLEHMNGQPNSSPNLNRQLSTKVNYSSGASLNLMEFPSMSESNHVISSPQEEVFDPLIAKAVVSNL